MASEATRELSASGAASNRIDSSDERHQMTAFGMLRAVEAALARKGMALAGRSRRTRSRAGVLDRMARPNDGSGPVRSTGHRYRRIPSQITASVDHVTKGLSTLDQSPRRPTLPTE